jgi:hypothetical protein
MYAKGRGDPEGALFVIFEPQRHEGRKKYKKILEKFFP